MNEKATAFLADGIARLVRQHTTERLGPFQAKLDAHAEVNRNLNARIGELEERLARLEETTRIRRIA